MGIYETAFEFERRGISCRCFESKEDLLDALTGVIDQNDRVAMGGSVTLKELDVYEVLLGKCRELLWHWKVLAQEMARVRAEAMGADVYLTSSNAVIEDGRLYNVDGIGNRVAAMFFGPPRVIVIAGRNKLVPDLESAIERVKSVAAPKNAERLNRDLPCRYTGRCQDCRSAQRMCQVSVLIENRLEGRKLEVWLVDRDLGY